MVTNNFLSFFTDCNSDKKFENTENGQFANTDFFPIEHFLSHKGF